MRRRACWGALALGLFAAGCGKGEASVALVFPNEVAMSAVRRIQVQVFAPTTGGSAASDRDCRDFEDLAREGKDALGTPTRGDFPCPETAEGCPQGWFDGLELQRIEAGRQIVYVLAYASTELDATPILDGCTDRFDGTGGRDESSEVPIELSLVIPDSARLVKTAGDRQVGRAGEETAVPLEVEVQAVSPAGSGVAYVIPGVQVRYEVETPGFEVLGGGSPDRAEAFTDVDGRARMQVRLPTAPGAGTVLARAPAIAEAVNAAGQAEAEFSLSVTEPVSFGSADVLQLDDSYSPVEVVLGRLDSGADLDLVLLSCRGAPDNCAPGVDAQAPFGQTRLSVVQNVGGDATQLSVVGELGVLPAALVVADLEAPQGIDEIAVVNSRRGDCQDRVCPATGPCSCYGRAPGEPCPCEGSEVRIFGVSGAQVSLRTRQTMTASNAVDAAFYKSGDTEPYVGLALASQGRSRNEQPCSTASPCLPHDPVTTPLCATEPESCGCPPGEACEPCQNCAANAPGVCVARDKMVDLLEHDRGRDALYNRLGCQAYELFCDINNPEMSRCECLDSDITGNACTGKDVCNCQVPERVHIGGSTSAGRPYGVAAGPLNSERDWDLVAPSVGGLELIQNQSGGGTFEWQWKPVINVPIEEARILHLDSQSEQERGGTRAADVVWFAREACSTGTNFQKRCPMWLPPGEDETPGGCLGVYFTDGEDSVFSITPPSSGGCRRHSLEHAPDGLCVGRINVDDFLDVVVASAATNELLVFAGDGRGGLLDPPEVVALPAGGFGGPIDCGDVDGDGRDDVVVADAQSGRVYVLGTSP